MPQQLQLNLILLDNADNSLFNHATGETVSWILHNDCKIAYKNQCTHTQHFYDS